jgi:hypothetical protein
LVISAGSVELSAAVFATPSYRVEVGHFNIDMTFSIGYNKDSVAIVIAEGKLIKINLSGLGETLNRRCASEALLNTGRIYNKSALGYL